MPPFKHNVILTERTQEYCMGNTSTFYGALRVSHGHPEPFQIK